MLFGIYCAGSALLMVLVFLVMAMAINPHGRWRNRRQRMRNYALSSLITALVVLIIVGAVAALLGIFELGKVTDFNFPGDFLSAGTLGIILLVVLVLGFLAPVFLAFRFARPDKEKL